METRRSRVVAGAKSTLRRTLLVAAFLRSVASMSSPVETSFHVAGAWQSNLTTLHERFKYIYQAGALSDLTIGFSRDNTTVSVHRLVLSVSSPVLEPMLTASLPAREEMVLQDSPETFIKLLDYMYLGKMDLQSVEEAIRVYAISYKYQVQSASKECSQYLGNQLTVNNALTIFEAAEDFDDKELKDLCVKMMNKDPDVAIAQDPVLHLRKETLMVVLKMELNVSSETLMFDAALAWGRAQLSQRGEEPSSSALRKEVKDLLGEVRFLTMTCEEFIDSVLPSGVLLPVEAINLLRVIRGADVSLIPEATPLSPSRYVRGLSVKDLVIYNTRCNGDTVSLSKNNLENDLTLLHNFVSSKYILVHSLHLNYDGNIEIRRKDDGVAVASAPCESRKCNFSNPVPLQAGEAYDILLVDFVEFQGLGFLFGPPQAVRETIQETSLYYEFKYCKDLRINFWLKSPLNDKNYNPLPPERSYHSVPTIHPKVEEPRHSYWEY